MHRLLLLVCIYLLLHTNVVRGEGEWTVYMPTDRVYALLSYRGSLWAATGGGVAQWNTSDKTLKIHTPAHGLANPYVHALAVDSMGTLWAGTYKGLSRYDGHRWELVSRTCR